MNMQLFQGGLAAQSHILGANGNLARLKPF